MSFSYDQFARPGGQMEQIANYRQQQFDQQFFNVLVQRAEKTGFSSSTDGSIDYSTELDAFPSLEDAWNQYRSQAKQRFVKPDYIKFQEGYQKVAQLNQQKQLQDYSTAGLSGATPKDFQKLAKKNPNFHRRLINMSATNPELAAQLSQYMPGQSLSRKVGDNPMYYTGAAVGTAAGAAGAYNFMSAIPEETMTDAKTRYKSNIAGVKKLRGEVKAAQEILVDAKKSGDAAQIKYAEDQLKEARKNVKGKTGPAAETFRRDAKTRYTSMKDSDWLKGKKGLLVKGGAAMLGPLLIGKAAGAISDDETVGDLAQQSTSAAVGAKFTKDSIFSIVKKEGAAKIFKKVAAEKGYGFALKTIGKITGMTVGGALTGGVMAAAMAAWTVKDLYDVMEIISEIE